MRAPLRWMGGKGQLAPRLLPLLPPHHVYVEPFAGGASLLFAKAPAPVEVLNDLDLGLVNFYRVLRDPALFAEFDRLAALTPFARAEWQAARAAWATEPTPVLRAWAWWVWRRQQYGGGGSDTAGWGRTRFDSVSGMANSVQSYLAAVDGLAATHARLRTVQIECADGVTLIADYDSPETLFYVDPPYHPDTRTHWRYGVDLDAGGHTRLVDTLLTARGAVVLSGYAHPTYERLERAGWRRLAIETAAHSSGRNGARARQANTSRIELVWLNPLAANARQPALFALEGATP